MKCPKKTCPRCGTPLPHLGQRGQSSIVCQGNSRLYFCCRTCKEEWLLFQKCSDELLPLLGDMLDEGVRLLHAAECDE